MNLFILRQVVDRCHVGESNLSVIRYAISRLKNKKKTFLSLSKRQRKYFLKAVIERHHENRGLYSFVMGGEG